MYYLKQWVIVRNLLVMGYMWCCCWFLFFLIKFQLKYLPGSIYNNFIADGVAQLMAICLAGVMYSKWGIRISFTFLLTESLFGGFLILFLGHRCLELMPLFVALCKFGVSGTFVLLYVSTVDVFPTMFTATALGFMNFAARVFTMLDP